MVSLISESIKSDPMHPHTSIHTNTHMHNAWTKLRENGLLCTAGRGKNIHCSLIFCFPLLVCEHFVFSLFCLSRYGYTHLDTHTRNNLITVCNGRQRKVVRWGCILEQRRVRKDVIAYLFPMLKCQGLQLHSVSILSHYNAYIPG